MKVIQADMMDDSEIFISENESDEEEKESLASSESSNEREGDTIVVDLEGDKGNELRRAGGIKSRGNASKNFWTGVNGIDLYPSGKKASSNAWLHGGFKQDENGVLVKEKVFSKYCDLCLKYLNSPSNLMNHVREKHKDVNENEPN